MLTIHQTEQPLLDARDMCDTVKRQDALAEFLMMWVFLFQEMNFFFRVETLQQDVVLLEGYHNELIYKHSQMIQAPTVDKREGKKDVFVELRKIMLQNFAMTSTTSWQRFDRWQRAFVNDLLVRRDLC
jgi:hypothetical protein